FWAVLLLAAFWLYHFWTAAADRRSVGEAGVSATLRRWYAYGLLFLGLAFLLFGARNLLQQIWVLLVDRGQVIAPGGLVPTALATMLAGLLIWGFHSQWTARPPIVEDDRGSTLRAVQRFLALTGMATLAIGAAGLLWTLSDQLLNSLLNHPASEWRDRISLFVTLVVVGLPMWLTHWRQSPEPAERYTLSRRLYLYATLLGSVLAVLI